MKVRGKSEGKAGFKPVTIELTFETADEVAAFYVLFNSPAISRHLLSRNGIDNDAIRKCIRDELGEKYPESTKQWEQLKGLLH